MFYVVMDECRPRDEPAQWLSGSGRGTLSEGQNVWNYGVRILSVALELKNVIAQSDNWQCCLPPLTHYLIRLQLSQKALQLH